MLSILKPLCVFAHFLNFTLFPAIEYECDPVSPNPLVSLLILIQQSVYGYIVCNYILEKDID